MNPANDDALAAAAAQGTEEHEHTPYDAAAFCSKSEPAVQVDRTIAAQINREHELANHHADQAIEHARRAGALLLQVKAELPHGAFLPWVAAHVHVSPRQAQRYMGAALGKPLPVRVIAKCDTVSHLPAALVGDVQPAPKFVVTAAADDEHLRAIEGRPRKHGKPEQVQTVIAGRVKLKDVAPAPAVVLTDAGARVGLAEMSVPPKSESTTTAPAARRRTATARVQLSGAEAAQAAKVARAGAEALRGWACDVAKFHEVKRSRIDRIREKLQAALADLDRLVALAEKEETQADAPSTAAGRAEEVTTP